MGLLLRLIALRGLRRGEACELFWSDLDTAADGTATLTIGRQLVEVRGAPPPDRTQKRRQLPHRRP